MPEATTFRVQTYCKLAKDETGLTQLSSNRLDAVGALGWIMTEFPDEATEVTRTTPEGCDWDIVTLVIDWNKVPEHLRAPKIPQSRR